MSTGQANEAVFELLERLESQMSSVWTENQSLGASFECEKARDPSSVAVKLVRCPRHFNYVSTSYYSQSCSVKASISFCRQIPQTGHASIDRWELPRLGRACLSLQPSYQLGEWGSTREWILSTLNHHSSIIFSSQMSDPWAQQTGALTGVIGGNECFSKMVGPPTDLPETECPCRHSLFRPWRFKK